MKFEQKADENAFLHQNKNEMEKNGNAAASMLDTPLIKKQS